ncbi:MAG: ABC transporter permease subunit [Polyangiaceae bacterium]|jgi:ABC-type transport system involved in cytochrome c biogenesis permease component
MSSTIDTPARKPPWTRAWEALVDANPVLAKEVVLTARTPTYAGSIVLAPFVLGALVLLARMTMGHRLDRVVGRELFSVYFTGLAILIGTVGAALGSTVLVQEREAGALEALKFSSLGPRRIVLGKLAAVLLAEAAVVVCTLPLLAFVLALGGVSPGEASVAMCVAIACGVMTASIGVAVSAHAPNTRRSLLFSLLGAGGVGMGVMTWIWLASDCERARGAFGLARLYFDAPFDREYVALLCVLPGYAFATLLWLAYALATSGLTDTSEDRRLSIKRWTLWALGMGSVGLAACANAAGSQWRESIAIVSMIATASLATLLLFVFVAEPVRPTRRMQAHPPSLLLRALCPACLAPSIFFTIIASGVVLVSVPFLSGAGGHLEVGAIWSVASLSVLGGFMGSIAARRGGTWARACGALALVGVTLLVALLHDDSRGVTWADALCPLWLGPGDAAGARGVLVCSLLAWAAAAPASLAIMLRAVRVSQR